MLDTPPEEPESTPASETPIAPVEQPAAPAPPLPDKPKKSRRTLKLSLMLLVLIIVACGVAYAVRTRNNSTNATVKKDIPLLTYGFTNTGDMTPTYPVDAANSNETVIVADQMFEGLVRYQNEVNIAPALATSWSNPNNTTWVFNLRHGVKFNTGRTMTAADVKYSLDYAIANQGEEDNSTILAQASSISNVSVVNPYEVKITTDGPDAILLNQLAYLYVVDSKAKLGDPDAGTGPYSVKPGSGGPNSTTLDLLASNDYWGGHVYTREVQFKETSTSDQLATDTASGKIDMAGPFSNQQLAQIESKATYYSAINLPDLGIQYVEINLEKPSSPLASVAARQAVAYALDVPAIIKAGGLNGAQVSQVIPQVLPGYDPAIKNTPYNPTKAKQLLATVTTASAPITFVYSASEVDQATLIAKELDAVGFNVKLSSVSDDNAFFSQVASGQGDIFFLGYTTDTLDGLDMINNTVAGTPNFTSPELTSLINQAGSTIDPPTRIAILQKMEQLVANQVPTVPLYTAVRSYALTKPYVVNSGLPDVFTSTYLYQVYQK